MTECSQTSFGWAIKKITAKFDTDPLSSDGGLLLIRSADERLRLIERAAALLEDGREGGKVAHELRALLRQRVYGICAGHEDCNDALYLREDPMHRLAVGDALASQATLSRFENGQGWRALMRLNDLLVDIAKRDLRKAKEIVLDIDSTDDETHGKQQMSFFHGYYDHHMYHPLLVYANGRLIFVLLRPGNSHSGRGATAVLRKLIRRLRKITSGKIRVRGDAGFALPRLYTMLEAEGVEYVIGLITNERLRSYAEDAKHQATQLYFEKGETVQCFGSVEYQAESWKTPRRVIYKAEQLEQGDNRRFVVTNQTGEPEEIYDFYRKRGDVENRIKDLKNALKADRTSCHRFAANFFRLLIHSLAYVLLDHLRQCSASPVIQRMQFDTLRLNLIKIGAIVVQSVRRFVVHLPKSFRWTDEFIFLARTLAIPN